MDAAELRGAIAAEQRLLEPAVRADPAAVSELLDDDFTEIGQTGRVWTRSAIIAALAADSGDQAVVETSGWAVREVGPQLALVEFETSRDGIQVRRSTLWRLRDGVWRAVAHQATRIVS
ncbi:MAG: nuclear transport factor 2 family protein [Pseudolysinimonas sp.]